MASNRLPYFPFHVDDYLNDPAVLGMDADAEGLYIRLLCRSWRSPDPGRIPESLVPEMCGLHRLAEQYRVLWTDDSLDVSGGPMSGPENIAQSRSKDVLAQLASAFDLSEEGLWVQRRMVAEWRRIGGLKKSASEAGRKSVEARRLRTTVERPLNDRSTIVEVDLDLKKRSVKAFDSVPLTERDAETANPTPAGVKGPVAIATGKVNSDPGPAFWNDPNTRAEIERLTACGESEVAAKVLVLAKLNAEARLGGHR